MCGFEQNPNYELFKTSLEQLIAYENLISVSEENERSKSYHIAEE